MTHRDRGMYAPVPAHIHHSMGNAMFTTEDFAPAFSNVHYDADADKVFGYLDGIALCRLMNNRIREQVGNGPDDGMDIQAFIGEMEMRLNILAEAIERFWR